MGDKTLNEFFYKPEYKDKGQVEADKFNDALDVADLAIQENKDRTDKVMSGLDANKSASPVIGQMYIAKDSDKIYKCISAGTWSLIKNLDLSGNNTDDLPEGTNEYQATNIVKCADYDHPDDAIDAISSANKTLLVTEAETCDNDFTVPTNVMVKFERGGKWTINDGVTVTFNGHIDVGLFEIFSYTGTGTLNFGDVYLEKVYPQWWGALGDDSHDDTPAIQAALDSLPSRGGIVFLSAGTYRIYTTIHISAKQVLEGSSWQTARIEPNNFASEEDAIENTSGEGNGIILRNLYIYPYSNPGNLRDLIHFDDGGFVIDNLYIKSAPRYGIYLEDCWYSEIRHTQVRYSKEIGVRLDKCNGMTLYDVNVGFSGSAGGSSTTPYGIYDYYGRANSFIGCCFEGSIGDGSNGIGIYIRGARAALIEGCYIENNSGYGIYIHYQNSVANCSNVNIIGNWIAPAVNSYGIGIGYSANTVISYNYISNSGTNSIIIESEANRVKLEGNTTPRGIINLSKASITDYLFLNALPTSGTYYQGSEIKKWNASLGSIPGWRCLVSGTMGTLAATTGDIVNTKNILTDLSQLTGLDVGVYLDVVGAYAAKYITSTIGTVASTTVDASSASGQKVLNVTATANFVAGETIIIDRGTQNEIRVIDSIQSGVSLTLTENLTNTYTNEVVENCIVMSANASGTVNDAAVTYYNATWQAMAELGLANAAAQSDSTAEDVATLKTDFNALLAKLRTAKLMAT